MNGAIVRIEQVEIRNFKNVVHGIIDSKIHTNRTKQVCSDFMGRTVPERQP